MCIRDRAVDVQGRHAGEQDQEDQQKQLLQQTVAEGLGLFADADQQAVGSCLLYTSMGTFDDMVSGSSYFAKAWADYNAARNIRYSLKGGEEA